MEISALDLPTSPHDELERALYHDASPKDDAAIVVSGLCKRLAKNQSAEPEQGDGIEFGALR